VLEHVLVFLKEPQEPSRNGKPLSEWIALLKSSDVGLRNNAASVLISFGPQAAPAAKALAITLTDENADVRRHSALALGAIGPRAAEAKDALRNAAKKDTNASVRVWAARALAEISPDQVDEAVDALTSILTDERGGADRTAAADGLGNIGPKAKKALPRLKIAAEDKDSAIAEAARKAIEKIGAE
jgi:HEAT repeat protein